MKQKIGLDLKVFSYNFAGIGRYCLNLTHHLVRREKFNYVGYISPQTDLRLFERLKISTENGIHEQVQSTLLRSHVLLPISLSKKPVDIFHSMDNSSVSSVLNQNVGKVATIHDLIVFKYPQYFTTKHARIVQYLISKSIRQADHIITDSISTKKDLLQTFKKLSETKDHGTPYFSIIVVHGQGRRP